MSWNRKYVHKNFHKKSIRTKLMTKKVNKDIKTYLDNCSLTSGGTIRVYAGEPPLMEFEL